MLIQERLKLVLKLHNLTSSEFADRIGVQRSNVSHVLSGRNKPSLDFLEKIVNSFPRVNAHWLITGKMPVKLDENIKDDEKSMEKDLDSNSAKIKQSIEANSIKQSNIEIPVKIIEYYSDGTFKVFTPKQ